MSLGSAEPNARHFCSREVFAKARQTSRPEILGRWGVDPERKTLVFPVSKNRYDFIQTYYSEYFPHLARLFSAKPASEAQFLLISPHPIAAFTGLSNVVQIPLIPFPEFLAIVANSDLYLADSLISCIVNAFHLAVPAMLLTTTEKARPLAPNSFLRSGFFPYRVFPYGLVEICQLLEERFGISGCYEPVEVLDAADFADALQRILFDPAGRNRLAHRCQEWKSARLRLPSPRETLDAVLASPALPIGSNPGEFVAEKR
jgi:hypothetical protein